MIVVAGPATCLIVVVARRLVSALHTSRSCLDLTLGADQMRQVSGPSGPLPCPASKKWSTCRLRSMCADYESLVSDHPVSVLCSRLSVCELTPEDPREMSYAQV